jgi:hypothetical protein
VIELPDDRIGGVWKYIGIDIPLLAASDYLVGYFLSNDLGVVFIMAFAARLRTVCESEPVPIHSLMRVTVRAGWPRSKGWQIADPSPDCWTQGRIAGDFR